MRKRKSEDLRRAYTLYVLIPDFWNGKGPLWCFRTIKEMKNNILEGEFQDARVFKLNTYVTINSPKRIKLDV